LTVAWLAAGVAALALGAPGAAAGVSVRVRPVGQDGAVLRVLLTTSSAVLVDAVGVLTRAPARRCLRRLPRSARGMPLRGGLGGARRAVWPR
jgi:hypothetical protein